MGSSDKSGQPQPVGKVCHRENMQVRWGDMDAMRHVNNATYFKYFEHARASWMGKNDLYLREEAALPVLVATDAQYRLPIHYPQDIIVEISVGKLSSRSMTTHYRILDANDENICFTTGSAVLVWVDTKTQRAVKLPESVISMVK